MNNKEFINELSQKTGFTISETQKMVSNFIGAMGEMLQSDNSVVVPSFGAFEIKKKMERIMVNPSTKQRMLIPPKLVLAFKPHSSWKEKVKKEKK